MKGYSIISDKDFYDFAKNNNNKNYDSDIPYDDEDMEDENYPPSKGQMKLSMYDKDEYLD